MVETSVAGVSDSLTGAAAGLAARKHVPLRRQGVWTPLADRPDPIGLLEQQGQSRLRDLMPIRYGRMLTSPLAFYRGAAAIMSSDLAATPSSGIRTQICGDAHVQNMGSFAAPDGKLVFDINDFDETVRAPWECDVKRMAASVVLAGRESGHDAEGCHAAAAALVES